MKEVNFQILFWTDHLTPLGINKAQWLIKSIVLKGLKINKAEVKLNLRKGVLITQTAVYMLILG